LFAEAEPAPRDWPRPVFLYVGRVAVEKNLDAFLKLDLPGSKVVVGDGPARESLSRCYPSARFLGRLDGAELAAAYASADAFVFPSLTDTYGLVLVEALAAGVPVAAFPVPGPLDIVGDSGCGALNEDLRAAALAALEIPRARCKAFALGHGIRASAKRFLENITAATGVDLVSGIDQAAG
jgi:glycosyltransferase involved in cell wall biosynthesis